MIHYRLLFPTLLLAASGYAGDWSQPVEIRHDDNLSVSYQARVDGPYLVVKASLGAGWHTFALDNQKRAEEKLAGQPALSVDQPTVIKAADGLAIEGPWYQTPPKDFSRPQLRWFSWGYDREALFAAKIRRTGAPAAHLNIRGQACTETICKNIDVALTLPIPKSTAAAELNLKDLIPTR
jgi:hypothetical protein